MTNHRKEREGMFVPFRSKDDLTPEQALEIHSQWLYSDGIGYRHNVRLAWESQSFFGKMKARFLGQSWRQWVILFEKRLAAAGAASGSIKEMIDRVLATQDSEHEGYCGEGCVCYTPDGTPISEATEELPAPTATAVEVLHGTDSVQVGITDTGLVLGINRDEAEKHGVL